MKSFLVYAKGIGGPIQNIQHKKLSTEAKALPEKLTEMETSTNRQINQFSEIDNRKEDNQRYQEIQRKASRNGDKDDEKLQKIHNYRQNADTCTGEWKQQTYSQARNI